MSNTSESELLQNLTAPGWRQPLWYHYEQCAEAPYAFVFYFFGKVFNLVFGFPSNMLVIWSISTRKSEGSTSDIFMLNLAVMDAFFCLMTPVELLNRLYLDHWGIWLLQRFAYGVKDMAPLFLTCICLDRYIAVVHPIFFTNFINNRIRMFLSAFLWPLLLAYSLTDSILGVMSVTEAFSALILSAFFIMIFCNISIIWVLRRSVLGKEVMNPVKKKALKMVLILLAIIVFNYLPPVVLMPLIPTYTFVQFHCKISVTVYTIMDLSSTIEPILYISKMDRLNCCSCLKGLAKKSGNISE